MLRYWALEHHGTETLIAARTLPLEEDHLALAEDLEIPKKYKLLSPGAACVSSWDFVKPSNSST